MVSYTGFDHGAWAEKHLGKKLTEFQLRVFDILGIAYRGISYCNAPISWKTVFIVDDCNFKTVQVSVRGDELCTFDDDTLTNLVFLCHEARIRLSVSPCGPKYFRLAFFPRKEAGGISSRHPSLDEAVAAFHASLPADHRIIYRAPNPSNEVA